MACLRWPSRTPSRSPSRSRAGRGRCPAPRASTTISFETRTARSPSARCARWRCRRWPRPGETLWDIGGGSGSISVEWCLSHPGCQAPSASRRAADRAAHIRANAATVRPGSPAVGRRGPPRPTRWRAATAGGGVHRRWPVGGAADRSARALARARGWSRMRSRWNPRRCWPTGPGGSAATCCGSSWPRPRRWVASAAGRQRGPVVQWQVVL